MGCITSKASMTISMREELRLRHGFQSKSAASAWEELLTSNALTAPDSCKVMREKGLQDGKSFHTVEEYDALLERIHAQDVNMQQETRCDVDPGSVEMGSKRKAFARGLKTLDIEFPSVRVEIYSQGTYVTPKFGSYNAPTITVPQNAVFSPDLLAAFEDCMQQLQLEEDTILKHMLQLHYS